MNSDRKYVICLACEPMTKHYGDTQDEASAAFAAHVQGAHAGAGLAPYQWTSNEPGSFEEEYGGMDANGGKIVIESFSLHTHHGNPDMPPVTGECARCGDDMIESEYGDWLGDECLSCGMFVVTAMRVPQ